MNNNLFHIKEVIPCPQKAVDAFNKDSVKRSDYVISLYEMMNQPPFDVTSIAIDGQWGSGKTFFIKMLISLILVKLNDKELDEGLEELTKDPRVVNLNESNLFPIYYDSWENDLMSEPILSIIYTMCKEIGIDEKLKGDIEENIKSILKEVTKLFLKIPSMFMQFPDFSGLVDPICDLFKTDSNFVPVINTENLKKNINSLIDKMAEAKNKHIVIFIDELDRCKPSYTIKLLESVKHYFNNPNILFVFSVNIEELQHSIKCVYGQGFDSTSYLDRFFNIRFNLPLVNREDFIKNEFPNDYNGDIFSSIIYALSEIYNLQLRELIKFKDQVRYVANSFNKITASQYENGYEFTYVFFVPIAICLKFKNQDRFQLFISGKGYVVLEELMALNNRIINRICIKYLRKEHQSNPPDLLSCVNRAYSSIFSKETSPEIGNCIFWEDCYKIFNDKVSLLG